MQWSRFRPGAASKDARKKVMCEFPKQFTCEGLASASFEHISSQQAGCGTSTSIHVCMQPLYHASKWAQRILQRLQAPAPILKSTGPYPTGGPWGGLEQRLQACVSYAIDMFMCFQGRFEQ